MIDALVAQGRQTLKHGSRSFHAATQLFDRQTRDDVAMLYAWCRYCDDQIDGQQLGHGPVGRDAQTAAQAWGDIERRTKAALAGEPVDDPVFASFQRVVFRYQIPERYPLELLAGFAMDVQERRYETLTDTLEYCYHVAGVVGVMMSYILGVRDGMSVQRAADLGIALQLTNIVRDYSADARGRRVYVPQTWLREAGIPPQSLTEPDFAKASFGVLQRLLYAAEPYYASARWGLANMKFRSAWAVAAARDIYRAIGLDVLRRGPEGLCARTVSSRRSRMWRVLPSAFVALRAVLVERRTPLPPRPRELWSKTP